MFTESKLRIEQNLPSNRMSTLQESTMDKAGYNYSFYAALQIVPSCIILVSLSVTTIGILLVSIMLYQCCKYPKLIPPVKRITQWLVEQVFSVMLKKRTNNEGRKVYTVLNYEVPDGYVRLLLATVLNLIGVAVINFWDVFLFEQSYICSTDPDLVCFPLVNEMSPNSSTPPLDCSNTSNFQENNITSVICYMFAYRLGSAAGSALGLVTTTALTIYIIDLLLLKVSNGSGSTKHRAVLTIAIQITIVAVTMGIAAGLTYLQVQVASTMEEYLVIICTNLLIVLAISIGTICFPWCYFTKVNKQNRHGDELMMSHNIKVENQEQYYY